METLVVSINRKIRDFSIAFVIFFSNNHWREEVSSLFFLFCFFFPWETKEVNSCYFFQEKRNKEIRIIKKVFLIILSIREGFEAILALIRCLSKIHRIGKKIVVLTWSWHLWRQSVDFTLQETFFESFPNKIKFWIDICCLTIFFTCVFCDVI